MKNMNVYAVRARYPHDYVAPELSEAKDYYQIALSVKSLVLKKINIDLSWRSYFSTSQEPIIGKKIRVGLFTANEFNEEHLKDLGVMINLTAG